MDISKFFGTPLSEDKISIFVRFNPELLSVAEFITFDEYCSKKRRPRSMLYSEILSNPSFKAPPSVQAVQPTPSVQPLVSSVPKTPSPKKTLPSSKVATKVLPGSKEAPAKKQKTTAVIDSKSDFELVGPKMTVDLFDCQTDCLKKILEMVRQRKGWKDNGCLLFLEMGFGKTLVSMAVMIHMMKEKQKDMKHVFIAVSGRDLADQWKSEISSKSNFPEERIFILRSAKSFRTLKASMNKYQTSIVIMTYTAFSRMDAEKMDKLTDIDFSLAILDEAQHQRNVNTYMFINMERFFFGLTERPFILEATGTPYVNKITDLGALAQLMKIDLPCKNHPDVHMYSTKRWWVELGRGKHTDEYDCWKRDFVVGMNQEEIDKVTQGWGFTTHKYTYELNNEGISYKPYFILTHFFTILFEKIQSPKAKKMMLEIKQSIFRSIIFMTMILHHPATVVSENPAIRKQTSKAKGTSSNEQLRDVFKLCGIQEKELSWETPSVKLNKIIEIITDIRTRAPDEKIIVCSDYATFLNILYLHLIKSENVEKLGKPVLFAGGANPKVKSMGLEAFRSESTEFSILLLVTEKAIGLNLQRANHVIFTGASWNPAIDQQAECRVKRPGQKRDVHIHRMYTKGTIDVWQFFKLSEKFEQQRRWVKGIPERTTHEQFEAKIKQLFCLIRGEDAQYLREVKEKFEEVYSHLYEDKDRTDLRSTSSENASSFAIDFDQLKIDKKKLEESFETYQQFMNNLTYLSDHIRKEKKKAQPEESAFPNEFNEDHSLDIEGEIVCIKDTDFQAIESLVSKDNDLFRQVEENEKKLFETSNAGKQEIDFLFAEEEDEEDLTI